MQKICGKNINFSKKKFFILKAIFACIERSSDPFNLVKFKYTFTFWWYSTFISLKELNADCLRLLLYNRIACSALLWIKNNCSPKDSKFIALIIFVITLLYQFT